jgi:hypothetical protein
MVESAEGRMINGKRFERNGSGLMKKVDSLAIKLLILIRNCTTINHKPNKIKSNIK